MLTRRSKRVVLQYTKLWHTFAQNLSATPVKLHGHPKPSLLSYLNVPGSTPLLCKTVGQVIDDAAAQYGDSEAIVSLHQNLRRTFAQVQKDATDLAEGLLVIGLDKGDRIGIWGSNSYQWYITHHAAAKAGLVLVNINPAYQPRELKYGLERVGVKCLVMDDKFKSQNYYEILNKVAPEVERCDPGRTDSKELPHLKTVVSMSKTSLKGAFLFDEILDRGRVLNQDHNPKLDKLQNSVQFDNVFNIQFTSGTTGNPKGVMLSHHNLVNNAFFIGKRFEFTPKDKVCLAVPFFHCYGQVAGMIASMHHGVSLVLPSPHFDGVRSVEAVDQEKCTVLYGTPTMHVDMVNAVNSGKGHVSTLRLAVTAGAICPDDLARSMSKTFGARLGSCYGLTECSPVFYQSLAEDNDDLRVKTVGYPLEHTEVKIVDSDGQLVPLGTPGEMCTRGYMTMLGYWDDPAKTAEALKPDTRWFHTGDTFVMHESGHARIVGRTKEMIIRGGENIYPREVEDFLQQHEKIAEAYVFGVDDERMGEEVAVCVRVHDGEKLTETDVRAYCKGQISHFKIPRYITFRSSDEIPKTISGKVQKFRLKEQTMKEFRLKEIKRS